MDDQNASEIRACSRSGYTLGYTTETLEVTSDGIGSHLDPAAVKALLT